MLCIPYIFLIFLGFFIFFNKKNKLNRVLVYLGLFIVTPLYLIPNNNAVCVNFLNYSLEILSQKNTSFYLITAFILTFIVGILYNIRLNPINYKEIGFIFILVSCVICVICSNNLIISAILIQIIVILYSIILALDNPQNNKLHFIKFLSINFIGIFLLLIGIDFYINTTGKTTIENLVLFKHFSKYCILTGLVILLGFPLFVSNLIEIANCVKTTTALLLTIFLPIISLVLLIKLFSGEQILLYIGFIFTLYGILFSFLTSKLRKILTYSIIHNTGFIMMFISLTSDINWFVLNNFLFTYILCIISLFIIVSFCEFCFHKNDILELKGVFYFKPLIGIVLLFIAFNSLSLPFSTNFILKNIIFDTITTYNNYTIYIIMFFSSSSYALHIGFRILYFLYLSKPLKNNINAFKNFNINKTTNYILIIILLIMIAQIVILYLKSNISYLNNILNGFKIGFIGVFLFIMTYKLSNYKKELIIYKLGNIIIQLSCISLLNVLTILRKFYSTFIYKCKIFIITILENTLKITSLYYNSRMIIVILMLIIILGLTLTIL